MNNQIFSRLCLLAILAASPLYAGPAKVGTARFRQAEKLFGEGRYELSFNAYRDAAESFRLAGDDYALKYAYSLFWAGISQWLNSGNEQCFEYLDEARILLEELEQWEDLAYCLNEIGLINHELDRYPEALIRYTLAQEIYGEFNRKEDQAAVWVNIADLMSDLTNYEEELNFRQWIYGFWLGENNELNIAWAALNLGFCLENLGRIDEAPAYWEPAVVLFNRQGEYRQSMDTAYHLSRYFYNIGNTEKALLYYGAAFQNADELDVSYSLIQSDPSDYQETIRYLEKYLELESRLDPNERDFRRRADIHLIIGAAKELLSFISDSIESYEQALNDLLKIGLNEKAYGLSNKIGELNEEISRYREAAVSYRRCIDLLEGEYSTDYEMMQLIQLAEALRKSGELDEAEQTAKAGLTAGLREKNLYVETMTLHQLGAISSERYEYLRALEYHQRELDAAERMGLPDAITLALESIGDIYVEMGNYNLALQVLDTGIALADQLTQDYTLHTLLLDRSWLHRELGDLESARSDSSRDMKIVTALDYPKGLAEALGNLASIETAAGNYDIAEEYIHQAMDIFRSIGRTGEVATGYGNLGDHLADIERYDEAETAYRESLRLYREIGDLAGVAAASLSLSTLYAEKHDFPNSIEAGKAALAIYEDIDSPPGIVRTNSTMAAVYDESGDFESAFALSNQALSGARKLSDPGLTSRILGNHGVLYSNRGRYSEAIDCFEEAMAIAKNLKLPLDIGALRLNLAGGYESLGRFDEALGHLRMAHDTFADLGIKGKVAYALHLQSSLYRHWGRYETAVEYEEQSLAIRQETGMKADIAESLNNLGVLMMNTGDSHSSRRLLNEAMAIYLELDLKSGRLAVHNNLGLLDFEEGQYNNAAIQYQKALDLAVETGDMNSTGTIAGNVAGALVVLGNYDEALDLYETALDSLVETGAQVGIARVHSNIAATLWYLERYDASEGHFLQSIEIKEELRRTAKGSLRRDYIAAQVDSYKGLAACRMRMGKFSDAFDAVEMASARYLAELIGDDSVISSGVSIDDYRTGLPEGTAILSFANTDYWNPILLIANRSLVYGVESDQQELIQTLIDPYREDMEYVVPEIVEGLTGSRENSPHEALAGIVSYYRALITSPYLSAADEDAIRDIARKLYGFLFAPLENELRGVDELRIIPQGALAFLPFETLIMPDGRYLVEAYDISYLPSLTVDSLLSGRIYSGDRQSMLAFGGAVYNQRRYERDMEDVQRNLEYIEKEAVSALSRGLTTRPIYKKLGLMNWSNLPGSLEEVETIRRIVPDAVVYSGADVSEPFVKELSGTGELARYEVIHFATHGIVVPEIPDLSAVILSLSEDEMGEEDGFLNAGEIAGLNLRSDFVNLSACETGLGKIVAGEGVVGLTQAFLVAGANGISVSLWEVSDESTSKFMTGLYTEARDDGNYARSMNVMKRRFIADPELNAPFYWAPFVYYGQ